MNCLNWIDFNDNKIVNIHESFDILVVGSDLRIDERCTYLSNQFLVHSKEVHSFSVYYLGEEQSELKIIFNEVEIDILNVDFLNCLKNKRILLDMTTFDTPDLTYLLYVLCRAQIDFSISYVEPKEYRKRESTSSLGEHELSSEGNGVNYLFPFMPQYLPEALETFIISLGFEPYRLAGFIDSDEIKPDSQKICLLGIPAFNTGWERNAIKANYEILDPLGNNLQLQIIPADDPIQTYLKLQGVYISENVDLKKINILPIGTKPQSLGIIWFAINKMLNEQKNNIGLVYDFVKKIPNRTSGIKKVHIWEFDHSAIV